MGAYKVIIPDNLNNQPERHEIEAAHIVAQHYNQTVEFLKPLDDYRRTTPDIVMNGQLWEIKSPVGKSRRNIERQIKRALKQSRNIIIDGRRSSVADSIFESKLHYEVQNSHSIRRLIFISKEKEILEIVWKQ
jgi:hypothetical protein